ncbi:MAG: nucleotidyltransferase family protein [Anaerolineales bacterium]
MQLKVDKHTLGLIISGRKKSLNGDSFSGKKWGALAHKAQSEGVGPLLYRVLSNSGNFSSLPADTRDFLRLMYAGASMQNHLIFKELEVLTRLFHRAGISVVALKGACFALTIYPDLGLRPMGDLDLLVPKEKLASAAAIAKSLDYQMAQPEASPGLRDLINHEICLQKSGGRPVTLELHRSLVADKTFSYAVPVDWFWEQTESLKPLSSKMYFENLLTLTPEAQVLYAAGHAMLQHGGKNLPLSWFYDIDCLIRYYQEGLDWDLLLTQAKSFEWISALDAFLTQTVSYFDTPVPDHVSASLSESFDRHRDLVALKQTHPATHILAERQKLLSLNLYGRFRLVLALLIPSPTYMRWRYRLKSSWMLPVYYPLRWWGILKDTVRTLHSLAKTGLQE